MLLWKNASLGSRLSLFFAFPSPANYNAHVTHVNGEGLEPRIEEYSASSVRYGKTTRFRGSDDGGFSNVFLSLCLQTELDSPA